MISYVLNYRGRLTTICCNDNVNNIVRMTIGTIYKVLSRISLYILHLTTSGEAMSLLTYFSLFVAVVAKSNPQRKLVPRTY